MKTINEMRVFFERSDLDFDMYWLKTHHEIISQDKQYEDDLYKECNIIIDIFCLQEMKEITSKISEHREHNVQDSAYDYLQILNDLEIDFNLFVLLAGEDYFRSDFYTDDFESSQMYILCYLIDKNYHSMREILIRHYEDNHKLLDSLVKSLLIYEEYETAKFGIKTLEDCFDHPEVMELYEWANDGFMIYGRG